MVGVKLDAVRAEPFLEAVAEPRAVGHVKGEWRGLSILEKVAEQIQPLDGVHRDSLRGQLRKSRCDLAAHAGEEDTRPARELGACGAGQRKVQSDRRGHGQQRADKLPQAQAEAYGFLIFADFFWYFDLDRHPPLL